MPMKYISATALLLSSLCFYGCSSTDASAKGQTAKANEEAPGAPVKVARAEVRDVPVELKAMGNVEAFSTITVKAQIGGTLTGVHFREGDMVQKGDLLFEIDPRPYQETVRQWEANLARDQALLMQGEANLGRAQAQEAHYGLQAERYLKLADQGIFSREQAEQMAVELKARRSGVKAETATIESLKAAIRADEATLENAKLNLSYCSIRSPISGRTGQVYVKAGNLVKAVDVDLVTIHQIEPIYVAFSVPEANLNAIRRRHGGHGAVVRASAPSDEPVTGRLSFIDNNVDSGTGTFRLKATFDNRGHRLWPGQFVDVALQLEQKANAVTAPSAALQIGQAGHFVYVVNAQKTIEMRQVTAGPRAGNLVVIEKGLEGGEQVVTEGHLRLAPGIKVRVLP
jgi:multidrug efflux system membrane fusion protein